jgi:hypothetical protein
VEPELVNDLTEFTDNAASLSLPIHLLRHQADRRPHFVRSKPAVSRRMTLKDAIPAIHRGIYLYDFTVGSYLVFVAGCCFFRKQESKVNSSARYLDGSWASDGSPCQVSFGSLMFIAFRLL